jgi:hypothetical protein
VPQQGFQKVKPSLKQEQTMRMLENMDQLISKQGGKEKNQTGFNGANDNFCEDS